MPEDCVVFIYHQSIPIRWHLFNYIVPVQTAPPRPRARVADVLQTPHVTPSFTASEIAQGLQRAGVKITRQGVAKALQGIPAKVEKTVSGNGSVPSWHLEQIPNRYRAQLADGANRLGYQSPDALLKDKAPATIRSVANCSDKEIVNASKLRAALRIPLSLQADRSLSRNELIALGVEKYKAEFGYTCSHGHWWRIFCQVIAADAGIGNWERIEIYLPAKSASSKPVKRSKPAGVQSGEEFPTLASYIAGCGNPDNPSPIEWRGIWDEVFSEIRQAVAEGNPKFRVQAAMRSFLAQTRPFQGDTPTGIDRAFYRAKKAYEEKAGRPGAVEDNRRYNTGNHSGFAFPESDKELLIWTALSNHECRVKPAWFNLLGSGKFSAETTERYLGKSNEVPNSVMEEVRGELEIYRIIHQGPHAFRLAKGHVRRSMDCVPSLFCMTADDVTLPVYFYVPDGKGWFRLVRGQCLIVMCFRSNKILGWSLQPDPNYSSINIRTIFNRVFQEYQVPGVLYLENGIWKSSALLKGRKPTPFSDAELKQGLSEFGIRFIHHRRPQGKGGLERGIGLCQGFMPGSPGWCGRNERKDAPESLRRQMAEVMRKTDPVHPSKYFYSFDEMNARLGEIIALYNATPQPDSRHLDGLSPDEACRKFIGSNPPIQFTDRLRMLFATDSQFVPRLKLDGFVKRIGKRQFVYRGKSISHFVGHPVWTFFDPENPEVCIFTDKERSPESVVAAELHEEPGALDAVLDPDSEALQREQERIEGQASHLKAKYNVIRRTFEIPNRPILIDKKTVDFCDNANAARAAATQEKRQRVQIRKQVRTVQDATRLPLVQTTADGQGFTREEADFLKDFLESNE